MNTNEVVQSGHPARILVLEDDVLNAFLIEETLQLAGHKVVGPAKTIPHALTLLDQREVDAAIVDLQIGNKFSLAVGRRLDELGIPWAITTGHTHAAIDPDFSHIRVLVKPFTVASLLSLVEATVGSRAAATAAPA